ncbi:hypothetical protein GAG94_03180 [Lysinibacillus sphaericus]|nr:hypothetical protein GAG94_03180 [Lysinibacillus sphaericus]
MSYEVFYRIGELEGSVVIEGDSLKEVQEQTIIELEKMDAEYRYSNWLND